MSFETPEMKTITYSAETNEDEILESLEGASLSVIREAMMELHGHGTLSFIKVMLRQTQSLPLVSTASKVLSARALLSMPRWPRYQDFESSNLPFIFVSHTWKDVDHPDPNNSDLNEVKERVAEVFKIAAMIKDNDESIKDHKVEHDTIFAAVKEVMSHGDFGVWYDFSSLPQVPRNKEEQCFFKDQLPKIQDICSKSLMWVINDQNYLNRGWCFVECFFNYGGGKWPMFLKEDIKHQLHSKLKAFTIKFIKGEIKSIDEFSLKCTNGSDTQLLDGLVSSHIKTPIHRLRAFAPFHSILFNIYIMDKFTEDTKRLISDCQEHPFHPSLIHLIREIPADVYAINMSSATVSDTVFGDERLYNRVPIFSDRVKEGLVIMIGIFLAYQEKLISGDESRQSIQKVIDVHQLFHPWIKLTKFNSLQHDTLESTYV